jgi:hypothetical protein
VMMSEWAAAFISKTLPSQLADVLLQLAAEQNHILISKVH